MRRTPAPTDRHAAGPRQAAWTVALAALVAACAAAPSAAAASPTSPASPVAFVPPVEPGLYRCELDRRVTVRRVDHGRRELVLRWQDRELAMRSVPARTGALRYENAQAGLTWLVLADNAMLLDSRHGNRLANECRL